MEENIPLVQQLGGGTVVMLSDIPCVYFRSRHQPDLTAMTRSLEGGLAMEEKMSLVQQGGGGAERGEETVAMLSDDPYLYYRSRHQT